MRLLLTGSARNPNTIGAFIMRHFDGSFEFQMLGYPDAFSDLLRSHFFKAVYRLFPVLIVRKMDRLLVKQVDSFNPTVVLIFKGMEISKWSLKKIKKRGIKLVNYNFDHPFIHFSRGTGNRFVTEAIPYYDLHISYSTHIARALKEKFNVAVACIPFGFHLTNQQYAKLLVDEQPEIKRVCFVGNPDSLRVELLRKLLADGIEIDLFGFGWEKIFATTGGLTIHAPRKQGAFWDDPMEFWKVLRQYRVQLNFFRPHNEGSHNLRTFEVPACGGILLTPASDEQAQFFTPDEEIFFYRNYDNLLEQCKKLLHADKPWIDKVRASARARSLASDYSYERRTKDLVFLLNHL